MISELIGIVSGASGQFRRDDNVVDRFNHRYTVILLAIFAAISTTHQLVGEPITCWMPAEFQSGWKKYTNSLCWVNNTYFVPVDQDHLPKPDDERFPILYYQWIPFIFLGMAVFFYLPSVVWTSFNSKAGVDSDNILESAETFRKTDKVESKDNLLKLITNQIDRFVSSSPKTLAGIVIDKNSSITRTLRKTLCGRKFGNYLVLLYTFSKCLYIVNAFAQLFIMNSILRTDYTVFGIEAIIYASQEKEFLNHTIFPKVTFCDIHVRSLGNVNSYTLQCLLPINLYTEKMFVFLWFWITMVLIITIADLLGWILKSALTKDRYNFIHNHLLVSGCIDREHRMDQTLCFRFVHDYLRLDGVFVLRLIAQNTNKITSSEIITSLWYHWRGKYDVTLEPNDDESECIETISADTLPMKPTMSKKPQLPSKPPSYRPLGNPPPPPPPDFVYPSIDEVDNAPCHSSLPSPSAPPNEYKWNK